MDPQYHSLAFTPIRPPLNGRFYILREFESSVVESEVTICGKAVWQVPQVMCNDLMKLEDELVQTASILKQYVSCYRLHHHDVPTPQVYSHLDAHES